MMSRANLMQRATLVALGLLLASGAPAANADVMVIVTARNAVTTLTRDQIVDIFLGKSNHFPDGNQAVPIDQTEGSPTRDEFYLKYAGKSPAQIKAYWSKIIFTGRGQPPLSVANSAEVKRRVVENPHAIGYIEQGLVDGSVRVLATP